MEIYADIRQEVHINPKEVIEKLIEKEIGFGNWVFVENNKFYLGFEESMGCHSFIDKKEITHEQYDYVKALQLVLKRLTYETNDQKINNQNV
jgi:hypothetical protein